MYNLNFFDHVYIYAYTVLLYTKGLQKNLAFVKCLPISREQDYKKIKGKKYIHK